MASLNKAVFCNATIRDGLSTSQKVTLSRSTKTWLSQSKLPTDGLKCVEPPQNKGQNPFPLPLPTGTFPRPPTAMTSSSQMTVTSPAPPVTSAPPADRYDVIMMQNREIMVSYSWIIENWWRHRRALIIGLTVPAGVLVAVLIVVAVIFIRRKRQREFYQTI